MKKLIAVMITAVTALQLFAFSVAAEEPKVLLDSELLTQEACMTIAGFESTEWSSVRCGYSTTRAIYNNTGAAETYMIFDAGKGAGYTEAEFLITTHADHEWVVSNEEYLNKRVLYSNDMTTWEYAPDISAVKDPNTYYDGATAHYNYTISAKLSESARYIKLDFSGCATWRIFVHHAKLLGNPAEEEPSIEPDTYFTDPCTSMLLPQNDTMTAEYERMQAVSWAWEWISDQYRTYLTSNTWTAGDSITYTLKDKTRDIVSAEVNMLNCTKGGLTAESSRGGVIWGNKKAFEKLSEEPVEGSGNKEGYVKERYKVSIPKGAKKVKIIFPANYRIIDINLGLADAYYPYDRIALDSKPTGSYTDGKWTVSGNISAKSDTSLEATAILTVMRKGKMISMTEQKVDLTNGRAGFAISSEEVPEDSEAMLYIWNDRAQMIPILSAPYTIK